ncbi:hypothetical protein MRB53_032477 [Persea americana]|uniref:Uncharacterized protein n=1 Tax=Persea americana TaxID=3435 RepID=A0ACC2KSA7_PERAE|nr:hypothetical protein MRB53_032477 [Persea americana]
MAANNNIIPNDGEPTRPFFVVQFTNAIKLIPTNYITWKAQIKSILVGYGLFKFFDGTHLAPAQMITTNNVATPNPAYATWMRQDQLLYGALVGTLASTVAPLITQVDTSHEAWKILEDTYANPSRGHTNLLKEKLKTMTKGTQSVSEFMQQVKGCADLLASLGKKQDPEDIIDFEELHEKLINKELQNKLAAPPSNAPASAMTMHTKPNKNKQKAPYPPSNWSSPPPPSSAWQSPPPYHPVSPQPRPFKPFQGRCQWCRETGHVVGFCPIFRQTAPHLRPPPPVRPPYNPSPQPQAQHNIIQPSTQPWLVDSGASHHVTNDLQNLSLHYPYAGPDELIVGMNRDSATGLLLLPFSDSTTGEERLQQQLAPAAVGRLQSSSPRPYNPKNLSMFRCNDPDFPVSAFPTVVFSDNAEALLTRGDDDSEESLSRLAAWHDGSAKLAAIPFSGSCDDGHNSSVPLIGIVTEPSFLFEI